MLFRPLAIRYDVFPDRRGYDTPGSQKAPSAIRCIKTSPSSSYSQHPSTSQKAPSAKRRIKTGPPPPVGDGTVLRVRKHRAPEGALRPLSCSFDVEHPTIGQKAPSARRCIKTSMSSMSPMTFSSDRMHRAPKGALRRSFNHVANAPLCLVRKHRAPNGALRLFDLEITLVIALGVRKHRAPNGALRQMLRRRSLNFFSQVRKHRAPKGALRHSAVYHIGDRIKNVRKHRAP